MAASVKRRRNVAACAFKAARAALFAELRQRQLLQQPVQESTKHCGVREDLSFDLPDIINGRFVQ
jgi:hypothetical protein